jgi:hypothetical protein
LKAPGKNIIVFLYINVYNGLDINGIIVSNDVVKERTFPASSGGTIFVKMALFIGAETARKLVIAAPV